MTALPRQLGLTVLLLVASLWGCGGGSGSSSRNVAPPPPAEPPPADTGPASCSGGTAAGFACEGLDLAKQLTLTDLDGGSGSDLWGWTDPLDGTEYVLMGVNDGTVFVEISDPEAPVIVGKLDTRSTGAPWRDIKTLGEHAYIVADGAGAHGMQVFDLTRLRDATPGTNFLSDTDYVEFNEAHNLAINEATGFAYAVGTDTCGEGFHMIDLSTPTNPVFAGCVTGADVHDAQCVLYMGPDTAFQNTEVCFGSNEDHLGIVSVQDKASPVEISRATYPNLEFVHQGWLTDDHRFFVLNDEADETARGLNTQTVVFDVSDLANPVYLYSHAGTTTATDHNLFIVGNRMFQANYRAGLQILEFGDLTTDTLVQSAFFDTQPQSDAAGTDGAWSVYPFFTSGVLAVSDTEQGLFLLRESTP